ncbi:MAG: hypothetical protein ACTSUQ_12740 [Candidatus Freyarchaeota archaeon]
MKPSNVASRKDRRNVKEKAGHKIIHTIDGNVNRPGGNQTRIQAATVGTRNHKHRLLPVENGKNACTPNLYEPTRIG